MSIFFQIKFHKKDKDLIFHCLYDLPSFAYTHLLQFLADKNNLIT